MFSVVSVFIKKITMHLVKNAFLSLAAFTLMYLSATNGLGEIIFREDFLTETLDASKWDDQNASGESMTLIVSPYDSGYRCIFSNNTKYIINNSSWSIHSKSLDMLEWSLI